MVIFGPRANLFTTIGLVGAGVTVVILALLIWILPNTDYETRAGFAPPQPVPFSHKHHVSGLGIDCRYCHTAVETGADAGLPPTHTCMTCHSQVWTTAAILAPVRQSLAENVSLHWNRVYTLPDYVYFDHSIHVAKGVGCTECHGAIGEMALTKRAEPLQMRWCLGCHRNPAPHLRPRAEVFNVKWRRTPETPSGAALMAAYHIHPATLTDCSVCHR